jgi:hypothetical protein
VFTRLRRKLKAMRLKCEPDRARNTFCCSNFRRRKMMKTPDYVRRSVNAVNTILGAVECGWTAAWLGPLIQLTISA